MSQLEPWADLLQLVHLQGPRHLHGGEAKVHQHKVTERIPYDTSQVVGGKASGSTDSGSPARSNGASGPACDHGPDSATGCGTASPSRDTTADSPGLVRRIQTRGGRGLEVARDGIQCVTVVRKPLL